MQTLQAIGPYQLNDQGDGTVTVTYPPGSSDVLSVQPDGSIETRPKGTNGPYERAKVNGTSLAFCPLGTAGSTWFVPYAPMVPNV